MGGQVGSTLGGNSVPVENSCMSQMPNSCGLFPDLSNHRLGASYVPSCAERLKYLVQMRLGIFSAKGVLPLEFKPAHSVGDLLTQHLDELEQEAERKGGVLQALSDHFAWVYKAPRSVPGARAA
jgi:hypothetical protein